MLIGRGTVGDPVEGGPQRGGEDPAWAFDALDALLDPHVFLDPVRGADGTLVDLVVRRPNPAAVAYSRMSAEALDGSSALDLSEDRDRVLRMYGTVLETGEPLVLDDSEYVRTSGERRWFDLRAARVGDSVSLTWRDVTERHRAELDLARSEALLRTVLDNSRDTAARFDLELRVEYVNRRSVELSGIPAEDWIGRTTTELGYPPDLVAAFDAASRHVIATGEPTSYEFEITNLEGHRHYESNVAPIRGADGAVVGVIQTARDITDRVEAERRTAELATHDALTGLANRVQLVDEIERALAAGRRSGHRTAVLLVDLDRFKYVNDSAGHATGDLLIRAVADRISETVRASDLVARPGGDEFVVVMRDVEGPDEALRGAERLVEALRSPVGVAGADLYATASVGVAVSGPNSRPDDLVREADTAMYVAKEAGGDRAAVFNEELRAGARRRVRVEAELRTALTTGDLDVHYQPEVDLASGRVVAAEALLRWHHPDGTTWPAGRFVDVAEDTGLIVELGALVLRRACAAAASWSERRDGRPLMVRVNLSALQLADASLLDVVDDALAGSGLAPGHLCVEITETAYLRSTRTVRDNLRRISERGIHIASDDFGTGYASLSQLREYPIDAIKVDRSFTADLVRDEQTRRLVAGTIALAHRLGLGVTAEGVEHPAQAELLLAMGCPLVQGFLYSPAVAAAEFEALLDGELPSG